jgi:hypothetical protein
VQVAAAELGAFSWARRRGGPAAGWIALAGGQRELITAAEQKESDLLEDEVTGWCSWTFESNKRGAWLGLQTRVLTWERLLVAAVTSIGYQMLVVALPDEVRLWP